MSVPLLPPPFDQLGRKPFSFYPALVGVEHNQWQLGKVNWSEVQVINTRTGDEIWIPRRMLGELSRTDEPVMIVGLVRELEYRMGQVIPHVRRVIEMPRAVNDVPRSAPAEPVTPAAPVIGIRLDSGAEGKVGRLLIGGVGIALVALSMIALFFRIERTPRVRYSTVLQSELGLVAGDDYFAVIRKLGQPASDEWRSPRGEMQYRILKYPNLSISVILMGAERDRATYIGAVDENWRPVNAVSLPGGKNTYSLLRSLRTSSASR